MTKQDYFKYTGNSDVLYGGIKFPDFEWEEVVEFLTALGYMILLYEGTGSFVEKISHPAGEVRDGKTYDDKGTTVLAIKLGVEVTGRLDSEEVKYHNLMRVFNREIKRRLFEK